ncbi:MAG: choice-of-anchor D domain-containing protein [Deltaproteobacteria bacterium]|nr:choice-of-anchor D domain-containing protein [Deltaproteobacteria bacterium]
MRVRITILLALVATTTACPPPIDPIDARIAIDVCAEPVVEVNGENIGGTDDCAVDFGDVDLSERAERLITITNPTSVELVFQPLQLAAGGDVVFVLSQPPTTIGPGLSAQVGISLFSVLAADFATVLVVESNAANAAEIRIPITASVVDNGVPDLEIAFEDCVSAGQLEPSLASVDFARVGIGGLSECTLLVRNTGARELTLLNVTFSGSDALHASTPADDTVLAAGAQSRLRLGFAPRSTGVFGATLAIRSTDPDVGVVQIAMSGFGVDAPTCTARVRSVNGVEVIGAPAIEALDDVVVVVDGVPSTPDGSIASYAWELTERPPGSNVVLSTSSAGETGWIVDVTGRYEACASVIDDLGTGSIQACCVAFDAVSASESVFVELTWLGDEFDDMDLHMTKKDDADKFCVNSLGAGGSNVSAPFETCAGLDCAYFNCNVGDTGVEWDGVAGRGAGDPVLDIDDTDGFGPERIHVSSLAPGSYAFGANYFSGSVPATIFVRLFLGGRLAGNWIATLEDSFLGVAILHVAEGGAICIDDLTDNDDPCPGF